MGTVAPEQHSKLGITNFLRKRSEVISLESGVEVPQPVRLRILSEKTCFLNLLPDDLLDVLHMRSLRGLVRPRVLEC